MAITLINKYGEYIKQVDTANEKLIFTKNEDEAKNYSDRPGGGEWNAENERDFIIHYFEEEFEDKVTSLQVTWIE